MEDMTWGHVSNIVNIYSGALHQILIHIGCIGKIPEELSRHVNLREVNGSLGSPNEMTADEVKANLRSHINFFTAAICYAKDNQPRKLIEGKN